MTPTHSIGGMSLFGIRMHILHPSWRWADDYLEKTPEASTFLLLVLFSSNFWCMSAWAPVVGLVNLMTFSWIIMSSFFQSQRNRWECVKSYQKGRHVLVINRVSSLLYTEVLKIMWQAWAMEVKRLVLQLLSTLKLERFHRVTSRPITNGPPLFSHLR